MVPRKPQWWQLYLLGVMMVPLLLAAHFAFAETAVRYLAQIGIVLITYGLILAWLKSQAGAIEYDHWAQHDEIADHELSPADSQAFYHLVLSRRDADLQK